ncbi:hypothetical protein H0H81_005255, partial [Sphagnurus paluster]
MLQSKSHLFKQLEPYQSQKNRKLYEALLGQFSEKSTTTPATEVPTGPFGCIKAFDTYEHEDFPLVTIWTAQDWSTSFKNRKNGESGIHQQSSKRGNSDEMRASMGYIQDRQGLSVSATKAAAISHCARSIWRDLASHGLAPKTWTKVLPSAFQYYRQEMFKFHDDLRLADGDWKIERLAIDLYSGWRRTYMKESKQESDENLYTPAKRKRSTSTSQTVKAKHEKIEAAISELPEIIQGGSGCLNKAITESGMSTSGPVDDSTIVNDETDELALPKALHNNPHADVSGHSSDSISSEATRDQIDSHDIGSLPAIANHDQGPHHTKSSGDHSSKAEGETEPPPEISLAVDASTHANVHHTLAVTPTVTITTPVNPVMAPPALQNIGIDQQGTSPLVSNDDTSKTAELEEDRASATNARLTEEKKP